VAARLLALRGGYDEVYLNIWCEIP
jgi:hypothetical protein